MRPSLVRPWSFRAPLLVASLLVLPLAASAQDPNAPVDRRPANKRPTAEEIAHPPKTWVDPDTGHRIYRLSDEPGSGSFYFNVNGYTPDGNQMVYTVDTPRGSGSPDNDGIYVLDLRTKATHLLVKGRVHALVVGAKTPTVFYTQTQQGLPPLADTATMQERMRQPQAIYGANIETGAVKMLAKIPPRYSLVTVNADETLAAGTFEEIENAPGRYNSAAERAPGARTATQTSPMDQPRNKGQMMEQRLAAKIPLTLFTLNLTGSGKITPLIEHSTDWINHLLFSPTDPQLLMYCHEGPWHKVDRIWTIHTDGTQNRLMHKRTMQMEIAGHEFWGWSDGARIYYDLQTPKG